jgi:mannose-6-phosphate isomerase-like protein (cupin superfamily)
MWLWGVTDATRGGLASAPGLPLNFPTCDNRRLRMTEPKTFSYTTYLDIKFDPLALIDVDQLAKSVTDQWYNQTLCRVNDSVVRLGVMQGEYHWHKHDNDDEFFYVLSGRFIIDLDEGRSVELLPHQGFVVPKGVMHCTRAPEKSVILMVETAAIVPGKCGEVGGPQPDLDSSGIFRRYSDGFAN